MKSKLQTRYLTVSISLLIFLFAATGCNGVGSSGKDLEARVNNLQSEINSLISTNDKLRSEVDNLTTKMKSMETDLNAAKTGIGNLSTQMLVK